MTDVSPRKREALQRRSWVENDAHKLSEDGAREPREGAPPSPAPGVGTLAARKRRGGSKRDSGADASCGAADAAGHGSQASKRAKPDGGGGKGGVAPDDGERASRGAALGASDSAPAPGAHAAALASLRRRRLRQSQFRSVDIAFEGTAERIGRVTAQGDLVLASAAAAPKVACMSAADVEETLEEVCERLAERRAASEAKALALARRSFDGIVDVLADPVRSYKVAAAAPKAAGTGAAADDALYELLAERRAASEAAAPPPAAAAPVPTANAAPAEAAAPPSAEAFVRRRSARARKPTGNAEAPPPAATPAPRATPKVARLSAAADDAETPDELSLEEPLAERRAASEAAAPPPAAAAPGATPPAAGTGAAVAGARGGVAKRPRRAASKAAAPPSATPPPAETANAAPEREAVVEAKAKEANSSIRDGKWTSQERAYACCVLDLAEAGQLPGCADNVTRGACLVYALGRDVLLIGQRLKALGLLKGRLLRCKFRRVGPCSDAALGRLVELRDAFHATLDKSVLAALPAAAAKVGAVFVVASQDELADANKAEVDPATKAEREAKAKEREAKAKEREAKADAALKAKAKEREAKADAALKAKAERKAKADAAPKAKAKADGSSAFLKKFKGMPSEAALKRVGNFGMGRKDGCGFVMTDEPGRISGTGDSKGVAYAHRCTYAERGRAFVTAAKILTAYALVRMAAAFEHVVEGHVFERKSTESELTKGGWVNAGTTQGNGKSRHVAFGNPGTFNGDYMLRYGAEALPLREHNAMSTLCGGLTSTFEVRDCGIYSASHKSNAKIFLTPAAHEGTEGAVTHDAHRDCLSLGAGGVIPLLATHVVISYAKLNKVTRKLEPLNKEQAAALELDHLSGVSFMVKHVDPTGRGYMDQESEIIVRVGHNESYTFDGVANAAFIHKVVNAKNPYPGLVRVTHVSFMAAN